MVMWHLLNNWVVLLCVHGHHGVTESGRHCSFVAIAGKELTNFLRWEEKSACLQKVYLYNWLESQNI